MQKNGYASLLIWKEAHGTYRAGKTSAAYRGVISHLTFYTGEYALPISNACILRTPRNINKSSDGIKHVPVSSKKHLQ